MKKHYNAYVKLTNNSVVPEGCSLAMLPNMTKTTLVFDENSKHFFSTTWLDFNGNPQTLLVTPVKAMFIDHDGDLCYEV